MKRMRQSNFQRTNQKKVCFVSLRRKIRNCLSLFSVCVCRIQRRILSIPGETSLAARSKEKRLYSQATGSRVLNGTKSLSRLCLVQVLWHFIDSYKQQILLLQPKFRKCLQPTLSLISERRKRNDEDKTKGDSLAVKKTSTATRLPSISVQMWKIIIIMKRGRHLKRTQRTRWRLRRPGSLLGLQNGEKGNKRKSFAKRTATSKIKSGKFILNRKA